MDGTSTANYMAEVCLYDIELTYMAEVCLYDIELTYMAELCLYDIELTLTLTLKSAHSTKCCDGRALGKPGPAAGERPG